MQHAVRLSHSLLAVETEQRIHVMLTLKAPPTPTTEHPPLHLALVIDRSGSMGGGKLTTTKACARFLVERLRPQDQLALVTFETSVELLTPLGPVDQKEILARIASIQATGTTNLSGGWLKGLEQLRAATGEGQRRILLLTDGQANVGIKDVATLEQLSGNARETGISTSTIGYGGGFNEDLLTAMSEAGQGNAYFAAGTEEAPAIFEQEFEGLASVVAQNVSVEIRTSPGVSLERVLNEYRSVDVPGGIHLELGDAYGDEERRVVAELSVPGLEDMGEREIGRMILRYVSVGEEVAAHEVTIPIVANLVPHGEADDAPDSVVAEEVLILMAADARRRAMELADRGQFEQASAVLDDAAMRLDDRAPASPRRDELAEDSRQLKMTSDQLKSMSYDSSSRKRMHYERHRTSRSVQDKYKRLEEMKREMEEHNRRIDEQ